MALNMPVFYKRTASAIVFAAIMLVGLLWRADAFLALVCVINVLCLREFFKLMKKIDPETHWPLWLEVIVQFLGGIILVGLTPLKEYYHMPSFDPVGQLRNIVQQVAPLTLILPAIIIIIGVVSSKNITKAVFMSLGGLLYITLPMCCLLVMKDKSDILPIALILTIWTNDTMAYLVGSFIGKTPFSPISPKKTWEGTGGGALLTMIGAMAYGYFSHKFRLVDWAVLGLCAAVAGTLGDLVESKLKRMAEVKDSGNIMPGHGGALDRFDSLLLAAPFAGCYVMLFM
jgi:phosphatidate cytidylyltransferase